MFRLLQGDGPPCAAEVRAEVAGDGVEVRGPFPDLPLLVHPEKAEKGLLSDILSGLGMAEFHIAVPVHLVIEFFQVHGNDRPPFYFIRRILPAVCAENFLEIISPAVHLIIRPHLHIHIPLCVFTAFRSLFYVLL